MSSAIVAYHEAAIGKGIVYGFAVRECHHPKDAVAELWHSSPISNAAVWLYFPMQGVSQDVFAPLLSDVGPFPKHDSVEIPCRLEHASLRAGVVRERSAVGNQAATGCLLTLAV